MSTEKIKTSLEVAKDKLIQLGIEEQLVSEIEWCLGSFAHDGVSEGLYVKAGEAVTALKTYKKANDRKVSKKLIDDIEKAMKN